MEPAVDLSVLDEPDQETIRTVVSRLVESNREVAPPEGHRRVAVVARDGGTLVGGAVGYTHWGWLFVSHLWVNDAHRGAGLGSRLMELIECEGRRRGAGAAYLDTYEFQALDFYQRLGYKVFGVLEDFPVGHSRFFLQKSLAQSADDPSAPS